MKLGRYSIFISGLMMAGAASAASVIETRELDGSTSVMTVDGDRARLQSEPGNYIIMNLSEHSFLSVDLQAGRVIDVGEAPPITADSEPKERIETAAELKLKGEGPKIAGYPTRHYQLIADGQTCLDTYLSKEAMEAANMQTFLKAFEEFYAQQKELYLKAGVEYEPCDDAQGLANARYVQLGMPLRTVDSDGYELQEVIRIKTNVKLEPDTFHVPDDLPVIGMEQMLRGG